jgi:thioredoxin 1
VRRDGGGPDAGEDDELASRALTVSRLTLQHVIADGVGYGEWAPGGFPAWDTREEAVSDRIVDVNDASFAEEVLGSDRPVLVDFWADWCGPCHLVAPVVEEIAVERSETLRVAKLNVDDSPHTPQRYGVQGIPTLILFENGQERSRVVGARGKDAIVEALKLEAVA